MSKITTKEKLIKYLDKNKNPKVIPEKIDIKNAIFEDEINFTEITFEKPVTFKKCRFKSYVSFQEATFEDEVKFDASVFEKGVNFSEVEFQGDTYFRDVEFQEYVTFENSEAKESSIDFNNVKFQKINFEKILFNHPNFINMQTFSNSKKNTPFSTENFSSKESARVVKAALDERRNSTEATQYFIVEQDFFLQSLKRVGHHLKAIPLLMDKTVSNYGTDYKRVLFTFVLYCLIIYCITQNIILPDIHLSFKDFVEVLIPLKMIGLQYSVENSIIHKVPLVFIIFARIGVLYFVYQFIRAFRVNTKRV